MQSGNLYQDFPITTPGNSLTTFSNLPTFLFEKSKTQRGVFYGVLRTNENLDEIWRISLKLSFNATLVAVGFGASIIILHYFFKKGAKHILFCDREPYVYLLGKIIFKNLKDQPNFFQFLVNFLDDQKFTLLFKRVLSEEKEDSPVFLRKTKEELMSSENIPKELNYLRFRIFDRDSLLTEKDLSRFEPLINYLTRRRERELRKMEVRDKQRRWLSKFLRSKRMGYILRLLKSDYYYFQTIANSKVCEFYCLDIFHPDFWRFLIWRKDLWKEGPGIFYLSNVIVYSKNIRARKRIISTSHTYDPSVIKTFEEITGQKNYYIYTIAKEYYVAKMIHNVPTLTQLSEGFVNFYRRRPFIRIL